MTVRLKIWSICASAGRRKLCLAARSRNYATDTTSIPPKSAGHDSDHDFLARFDMAKPAGAGADVKTSVNEKAVRQLQEIAYGLEPLDPEIEGHKFGLPELPIPAKAGLKYRYDSVIVQLTKLLMRDGKLAKAQRDMSMILLYLRTAPPPKSNPARPLLPGSPPMHHLPLNPVLYLTLAIDSVAPLIRIRHYVGLAGGGHSLDIPVPLIARQRRRTAFQWVLDAVNKKAPKGSGRAMLPNRIAEEIVAIVEGKSSVWDRRQQLHKLATAARANMNHYHMKRKNRQ